MGKLIMWNLQTLDGRFEGRTPWDLAFHSSVWGPELEQLSLEQLATADALVFGRATYQGMASYWTTSEPGAVADLMNRVPKLVFSRTLKEVAWNNSRLVTGDAAAEIPRLKRESEKNLFIFGSANLSATLMAAGLIDEYRVCIAPVVLGCGEPLFKPADTPLALRLSDARPLQSGGVILRYAPASPAAAG